MKKLFWLLLVLSLALVMVVGCGEAPAEEEPQPDEETPDEEAPDEEAAADGVSTMGLGIVTSIGRSVDYDPDADVMATGQVDTTMATATFDEEGRIVDVMIDVAQVRVEFDEDLQVATDPSQEFRTKKELGDDYGMRKASDIEKEWDEQIEALEEWMVGKTVDEVLALPLMEDDQSPDDPDLRTSVTITVTNYFAALEKAYQNAESVEHGAEMLGLGHNIGINRSVSLDLDNDVMPMAQVDVIIAGAVFNDEGQVGAVQIDTAQTRINFSEEGQVTSDPTAEYPTKKELGDDYGMRKASDIEKEWDEQIEALEEWIVGKTVDEVLALPLVDDEGSPDDPDLRTSVTMTVSGYFEALAEAYSLAR
ncbi:MAG: hypothetical protein ACQES4_04835 [Bacillota bacterium]